MDTARGSSCSLCPGATTCKQGGDGVQCQPLNHIYVTMSKQAHTMQYMYVVGARVKHFNKR